ncbi:LacI family DNA-binding transcriptional regulator [Nocardiopsis oceani]
MAEQETEGHARRVASVPTMEDVARRAGVSRGTVSNVLNRPSVVAEPTRERVQAAITELGFVRNHVARSLVVGHADTFGFVVVDLANSYFLDIVRGAERLADQQSVRFLLANSDVDLAKQDSSLDLFEESRVSGILLAPLDGPMDRAEQVRRRNLPIVYVNWAGVDGESCGVVVDEEAGGYLAASHVIDAGARRLVFAGGPLTLSAIEGRLRGVERAVAEADGTVSLNVWETDRLTTPAGLSVGSDIVDLPEQERPDALVAASDALAAGAVQALLYSGVRVPEDLLVIGYDNNHFASDHVVPISTVSQPGDEMGRIATSLLLEEVARHPEHEHRTIVLSPRLIPRASTDTIVGVADT